MTMTSAGRQDYVKHRCDRPDLIELQPAANSIAGQLCCSAAGVVPPKSPNCGAPCEFSFQTVLFITVTLFNGFLPNKGDNNHKMAGLMKKTLLTLIVGLGFCLQANADIWKWTDSKGDVHFVNTTTPIYTWVGDDGRVHYSDTPDHEGAVLVNLVWHSVGDPAESAPAEKSKSRMSRAVPGESDAEKNERESAEAYYCKRAREIYDSYLTAPRLYETTEQGDRRYLSEKESATMLVDTKSKVDALCD